MSIFKLYNIMQRSYNIFIVGTTSVGKTKLSLALANELNTEIISCDSMQLYKHADIMTAKATKEEQEKAKHHMLDLIELEGVGFNRNMYYDEAKKVFDRLHGEGKSAVIVGGTNYYIESLLFENGMGADKLKEKEKEQNEDKQQEIEKEEKDNGENINKSQNQPFDIVPQEQKLRILSLQQQSLSMSPLSKYNLLLSIDPLLAAKIHKNDHQRISNYLNKYFTTFKKPSLSYQLPTYKLRSPNTIVFWIKNQDREELKTMITKRIDEMLDIKGLSEIVSIHLYLENCEDNLGGVLQSIGYKEFKEFVDQLKIEVSKNIFQNYPKLHQHVTSCLKQTDLSQYSSVLQKCKSALVLSTVQYAKRQITWIKNRLFGSKQISNNFFILDITGEGDIYKRFDLQVKQKAIEIIKTIDKQGFGAITGGLDEREIEKIEMYGQVKGMGEWKKFNCQLCVKEMNGKLEFDQHMRSSYHKKMVKQKNRLLNKREEIEELKFGRHVE